jgi:selenium metabolism protein YedF
MHWGINDLSENLIISNQFGGKDMRIDAGGKQCPIPVIMAKKELEAGEQDVEIIVDGPTQVGNLERLGDALGRKATSEAFGDKFLVKFANGETIKGAQVAEADTYAVFFNTNAIGTNESELGGNLAKMAIFTLSESERVPSYVLFMNEGVKLPAGNEAQIIENLNTLIEKGTKVLVCGTCLNFYGIKDDLKVGTVSNMYDILGAMQEVSKVIKL